MNFPQVLFASKVIRNKDEYIEFHSHDETEFVFYENGNGETCINGRKYKYSGGSIAVIHNGSVHDETHYSDSHILFFRVRTSELMIHSGLYTPNNFSVLHKLAVQIYNEIKFPQYGFNTLISAKCEELIILLTRQTLSFKSNSLDDIMQYIKDNCCAKIDIKTLAEKKGLGYETMRHIFKKVYGISPYSFIIYHRLQKSMELLCDTNKSCTEIAFECGFSDSAQFSKMFKTQFGISPRQYRKSVE